MGQVRVTYSPTTISPGVETEITVSVTNTSNQVDSLCGLNINLFADDGLEVVGFRWIPASFSDTDQWFVDDRIPQPQAAAIAEGLDVPLNTPVALAGVTVRADASAAGGSLTLDFVPTNDREGESADSLIADCEFFELDIESGRSVNLTVSGQSSGGDDGGSGGGGSGGGGGGGSGGGGMTGDGGMTGGDDMGGDGGTDMPDDGDMGDGTDMDMTGMDGDGDDGMMTDGGDDMSPPIDGGNFDDPGNDGGGTGDNGQGGMTPDDGTGDAGDMMEPMMPAGFCAPAMMMPTLFSLFSLSVMKRRRGRSG